MWVCVCWPDERCDRLKNTCETFRLNFSIGSASRNSQSNKVDVFDSARRPDLGLTQSKKDVFA